MNHKGLLGALFDLSFSEFVTTRVIKMLFIIGIVFAALGAFTLLVSGFSSGFGKGLLMLILSPLVFLLYVLAARIWCEIIIVVFRIAENTARIANASQPPAKSERPDENLD